MPAFSVSLTGDQLKRRMQDRLRGLNPSAPGTVLWQEGGNRVLIYIDTLAAKLLNGWLVCTLELQSDQTGRQSIQFVFFLGVSGSGDGAQAACTINAATTQAAQLASVWGSHLQRVLWDSVLDALEVSVEQAAPKQPGASLSLQGFHVTPNGLEAAVLVGDK